MSQVSNGGFPPISYIKKEKKEKIKINERSFASNLDIRKILNKPLSKTIENTKPSISIITSL